MLTFYSTEITQKSSHASVYVSVPWGDFEYMKCSRVPSWKKRGPKQPFVYREFISKLSLRNAKNIKRAEKCG